MTHINTFVLLGIALLLLICFAFVIFAFTIYIVMRKRDLSQDQHSISRNFPVLSRVRYVSEHVSPELKQYFFEGDHEGKPFSRIDFQFIVKAGKYAKTIIAFGSKRNFEKPGFYIRNAFFAKQLTDLEADNQDLIETKKYVIDKETLISRKEHNEAGQLKPWKYTDQDAIVIGRNMRLSFYPEKSCRYEWDELWSTWKSCHFCTVLWAKGCKYIHEYR